MKNKIYIIVKGGLVTGVSSTPDIKDIDISVIDYDNLEQGYCDLPPEKDEECIEYEELRDKNFLIDIY